MRWPREPQEWTGERRVRVVRRVRDVGDSILRVEGVERAKGGGGWLCLYSWSGHVYICVMCS